MTATPSQHWKDLLAQLEAKLKVFTPGLSNAEVQSVEEEFGFRFPPDLRVFLQHALPVSVNFPDWRSGDRSVLHEKLGWPLEGMLYDIEQSGFWMKRWGPRPLLLSDAFAVARAAVEQAPMLIPIYSHRYIPAEPCLAGNPVFSVYQTDIIYYGFDLPSYLVNEFHLRMPEGAVREPRPIRFWDEVVALNNALD